MKRTLAVVLLLINGYLLHAQDLIVTHAGDSLHAKITGIHDNNIYYTVTDKGTLLNTWISKDSAKTYEYNYFHPAPARMSRQEMIETLHSKWRVAINAGWSFRISETVSGLNSFEQDYLDGLKHGHQFQLEGDYFPSSRIGIGLIANVFFASNETYASATGPNGTVSGRLWDDITIWHVAPQFLYRYKSSTGNNAFLAGISIGYCHYQDNGGFIDPATVTGGTISVSYDFNYDIGINPNSAIGIGVSFKVAVLHSADVTQHGVTESLDFGEDNGEGLSRIDLSLGYRFR